MANSVDPDQTAPLGSALFAKTCVRKYRIITVVVFLTALAFFSAIFVGELEESWYEDQTILDVRYY